MKRLVIFICLYLYCQHAFACTTFLIYKNGQLAFGRNYDWITGNGMLCSNQRNLSKTSFKSKDGTQISWISKFGSLTFNQYGKEFPTGGMNEKGLVIELMWLDGTQYPVPDIRPAIGVLQWIQYHLDLCSNIEDVIAQDKNVRIASKGNTPLHYLIADANGDAAVIEFLDGKMTVHKKNDLPFPVLTNDRYDVSLNYATKTLKDPANNHAFTSNSIDRFTKACQMISQWSLPPSKTIVDYSFQILDEVAQGSHTKWSIVYDIKNRNIFFKSLGFQQVKKVSFAPFNFNCKLDSKVFNINQSISGDINNHFIDFSTKYNEQIIKKSFEESKSEIDTSQETVLDLKNYASQVTCLQRF